MAASPEMQARLKRHGLRVTPQRLRIALRVLGSHDHFTADELIAWSAKSKRPLSRATIYNTLNEFVAAGLMRSFRLTTTTGDKQVFDSNTGSHFHFIDTATQRVFDLDPALVSVRIKDLGEYEIEETEVFFRGRRRTR